MQPGSEHRNTDLDGFFTAARSEGERAALEMTKWMDSNYHYLVPEIGPDTVIDYRPGFGGIDPTDGPVAQILEALAASENAPRPVVVGPVSYLLLAKAADGAPTASTPWTGSMTSCTPTATCSPTCGSLEPAGFSSTSPLSSATPGTWSVSVFWR